MGDHRGETAKSLLACKAVSWLDFRQSLKSSQEVPHEQYSNVSP